MLSEDTYFHTLTDAEIWQRYCGFFDLSVDEFMEIQKELLMEEINLVSDSFLGKKIMGNRKPKSVDEFRSTVPLTTYDDYEPYLGEQNEDVLAVKPHYWCHSAGRGGSFKWVPHSLDSLEKGVKSYITAAIISSTRKRGEINIAPGTRMLAIAPPPPYSSGCMLQGFTERFTVKVMPPPESSETEEFQERIKQGFKMAIKEGVDFMGALSSVLVRMGEAVSQQTGGITLTRSMLHPKVVFLLLRAWLSVKIAGRGMLPKDIWRPKGIMVSGVDTYIYKDSVIHYWGVTPLEIYAGSECNTYALEGWNRKGMVFLPDTAFFEFIPYEQSLKSKEDESFKPSTVLLDELKEGELYEVVVTQPHGMPLLRYRLNDLIKVLSLSDDEAGVNLPHIAFQRRITDVINIGAMANLDEKVLWQAIADTDIKYTEWTACKEYDQNQAFVRLYLELKEEREASEIETMIDEKLKVIDVDYKDVQSVLNLQPIRVTLLSPGTFQAFTDEKTKEGADLAHLKPAHVNPPEALIQRLLEFSEMNSKD
jgi:hypothetical protein